MPRYLLLSLLASLLLLGACTSEDGDETTPPIEEPNLNSGETPDNNGETPDNNGETPDNNGETPDNNGETPDNNGETPDNNGENPDNNGENPDNNGENPDNNGEDPNGDLYANILDLENGELKDALHGIVDEHRSFGYNDARDLMYGRSASLDINDGMLECIYTGRQVAPDSTRTPGGFNTEHSWPRQDGADQEPARSDLHHLFPSDAQANQERGNHSFGNTSCNGNRCDWSEGGSKLGNNAQGDTVFQVRSERRGDVARAHFYFSIRYNLPIPRDEEDALREWNASDPPDMLERGRNDQIERFQRNRNPFVDHPEFVDQISDF